MNKNLATILGQNELSEHMTTYGKRLSGWLITILVIVSLNSVASAQVVTTFTDNLTSNSQYKRPNISASGNVLAASWTSQNTLYNYVVQTITVAVAGNYTIKTDTTHFNNRQDPMLFIYDNNFDPTTPLAHGIVANDDEAPGTWTESIIKNFYLDAGVYKLVVTVWDPESGEVDYSCSGPAAVSVSWTPTISLLESSVLGFTPGNSATALSSAITATYPNNLTGATIQITNNYQSGEDVLSFTNQNGITGSWNSSTGTLTLSGSASTANYQAALRSAAYQDISQTPNTSARTISFKVNDGSNLSNTLTRTINVLSQASNINFSNINSSSYSVNWTPLALGGHYLVVRKTGSAPSFVPVNGTEYPVGAQGADYIVYVGSGSSFTETGMSINTDYYYKIFTYQGSGNSCVYVTTTLPLQGINRVLDISTPTSVVPVTENVVSREFPNSGVSVIFTGGSAGTTLTVAKIENSQPTSSSNFKAAGDTYFSVTSTNQSPGTYSIILDFSSLNYSDWSSYKVYKRHDESSPWLDVTEAPINAIITNRSTDGVPGRFTIAGLTSFSQFALQGTSTGIKPVQSISILMPLNNERIQAGTTYNIAWKTTGFISGVKMEYSTDDGSTWQQILPDGTNQILAGLTAYPWQVPGGINSMNCRIRVSNWSNPNVFGISPEPFTLWDLSLASPSAGDKLYAGTSNEIKWNGNAFGGAVVKFSADGGNKWTEIGETSDKVTNKVVWKVPDITQGSCQVKVISKKDSSISTTNKSPFAIERLKGDVNADGTTDLVDVTNILEYLTGQKELDDRAVKAADVDNNNVVNSMDAYQIIYKIVNGSYPSENTTQKISASIAEVSVGKQEKKAEDLITIPVVIKNASSVNSLEIKLQIDKSSATLEKVINNLPQGWIITKSDLNGIIKIALAGVTELKDGTALSLEFRLKDKSNAVALQGAILLNGNINQNIQMNVSEQLPKEFSLSQNYPNPFNPSTTIKYSLPKDSKVRISVYNILGEVVTDMGEEVKTAGNYSTVWNAVNYSSGLYIYRITAKSLDGEKAFTKSIKMMLMK